MLKMQRTGQRIVQNGDFRKFATKTVMPRELFKQAVQ